MLVLPAKAAESRRTRRLQNRHHDRGATQRLRLRSRIASRVSLATHSMNPAPSVLVGSGRYARRPRTRRARRCSGAWRASESGSRPAIRRIRPTHPGDQCGALRLARPAGHHVLVAFPAALALKVGPRPSPAPSTSSKMKRLSLNERNGSTLSSSMVSNSGPCGSNPLVRLSNPVGVSERKSRLESAADSTCMWPEGWNRLARSWRCCPPRQGMSMQCSPEWRALPMAS